MADFTAGGPLAEVAGAMPAGLGPRGFAWLVPGRLGGTRQPGLVGPIAEDLAALRRVGATLLVTLTDEWQAPEAALARAGLAGLSFPIPDMEAPHPAAAAAFCAMLARRIEAGAVAVLHCRAGRGRTGTMLAAQLVWQGLSASDALAATRAHNPNWVESPAQEAFLGAFCRHLASVPATFPRK